MIQRDVLMRQVQMLAQALARVVFNKSTGQHDQAQQIIEQALGELDGQGAAGLREQPVERLFELCSTEAGFAPGLALGVADLLREDGDLFALRDRAKSARASYERALALYRRVQNEEGAAVPLDLGDRIAHVEEQLEGC